MMRNVALALICLVSFSCVYAGPPSPACTEKVHWSKKDQPDESHKAALEARASMERVRRKIEEWGLVTISAPVAVIDASKFSLGGDDDFPKFKDYMEKARTGLAASIAELDEQAVSNRGALVATPNLPAASTTTTTTLPSSLDPSTVTAPTTVTVASNLSSQTFSPLGKLLINTPSQISERQALSIAAGDKMTENLFRAMAQNNEIPGHNMILFAVMEVSCNPGWRTQGSYIADCTAFAEYYDRNKNAPLPHCENRQPTIFSVLPLIDAQTIEMANSQRQMSQLAANLAAAFPGQAANIKANDIYEFVKRSQRDAVSRSPIPVVNTYSTGKIMGFRFSPSFQAMKDPAMRKSKSANVLLPTAFPALVTLVFHDEDVKYVQSWVGRGADPCLLTHISTRWLLKDRPPLSEWYRRLVSPMKRETTEQRIDMASDVAEMYHCYNKARDQAKDFTFDPVLDELHRDAMELEAKAIGESWPIPFSKGLAKAIKVGMPKSQVHDIFLASPNAIEESKTTLIEFAGVGLEDVVAVQIGATKSSLVQFQPETGTLKAVFVNFQQFSADELASQQMAKQAAQKAAADAQATAKTADDKFTASVTDSGTQLTSVIGDIDKATTAFVAAATAIVPNANPPAAVTTLSGLAAAKSTAQAGIPTVAAAKAASPDAAVKALTDTASAINAAVTAFNAGIKALGAAPNVDAQQKLDAATALAAALTKDATTLTNTTSTNLSADATAAKTADAAVAKAPAPADSPASGGSTPSTSATTMPISIFVKNDKKSPHSTKASVILQKASQAANAPAPAPKVVSASPVPDANSSSEIASLFPGEPELNLADLETRTQPPALSVAARPIKRKARSTASIASRP